MSGTDPLARAGSAMRYWQTRQSALSHNLANANTTGFKAEKVFARVLDEVGRVEVATTDFDTGAITRTDRVLDVAIRGDGFFVVDTEDGPRLTRKGNFRVEDGFIVDTAGNQVRGEGGPIPILEGVVSIGADGEVLLDGEQVGRLTLARPRSPEALVREDAVNFVPGPDGFDELIPEEIRVEQGALEESNVDPVEAMVEMLDIQRRYAGIERTVRVMDEINETAATRLGRLR